MSAALRSLAAVLARATQAQGRLRTNSDGMAATEFAVIAPILVSLFIGIVEVSYGYMLDSRVQQVAGSMADLVARAETQIAPDDISDMMRAGSYIFAPFDQDAASITVRQVNSSPTNPSWTKQAWSCTFTGSDSSLNCACSNSDFTVPPNLVNANDSVVVGEVLYDYKPILFDYFLHRVLGSISDGSGGYNLRQSAYRKPRGNTAMLLQPNMTPCPAPTF